jgi:Protein of unknown function (DUF4232)
MALALAACGGSSHTTTAPVPTTTTPAGTTTTTPATTTSPTTTTATTPAAGSLCRAATLHVSYLGQQGATGHGEIGFALKNVGSQSCSTGGYPGVLFLDKAGAALPTTPTHTTHDLAGSVPDRPLTLAPGSSASFRLFVSHFGPSGSSTGCTTAAGLQVIPPNDTATLRTPIGDGGATECQTVTVSPLQPGTAAYP